MLKAFIPKDNQELPDGYGMTIHYVTGRKEEIEIAHHKIVEHVRIPNPEGKLQDERGRKFDLVPNPFPFLEIFTSEDQMIWIPMSSVQRFDFDKRYSKIIAISKTAKTENQPTQ